MVWMDGNALLAKWKNPTPHRGVQLNAPYATASSRQGRPPIYWRECVGGKDGDIRIFPSFHARP